jgi:hypothetical protein
MSRTWFLIVLVPALALVAGLLPYTALITPALLLALVVLAARTPRLLQLKHGLEQLRGLAIASFTLLPAGLALGHWLGETAGPAEAVTFGALFAVAALGVTGIASEFSQGTAPTWLTQPRSLRALLLERYAPGVLVSILLLGALVAGEPKVLRAVALVPVLSVVFGGFALAAALEVKEPLAAMLAVFIFASTGVEPHVAPVVPVVSAIALVWVLVRPRRWLHARLPGLPHVGFAPGRSSPWRALVMKELRLQSLCLGLLANMVLAWFLTPPELQLALFLGPPCAALAGVSAVAEERYHRTQWLDSGALPSALAWRVKVGVVLTLAVVCGALVPCGLLALGPANYAESAWFTLGWCLLSLVAAALGLASASSMTTEGSTSMRAFVVTLGLGAWALIIVLAGNLIPWFGLQAVTLPNLRGALADQTYQVARVLLFGAPLGLLFVLSLGVARRGWVAGGVPLRVMARASALVSVAALVTGVAHQVLALFRA